MDNRSKNKGTKGNKGGRPSKAEEQKLIDKLTPLEPLAFEKLKECMTKSQSWAIQMYFNYMYGKPKEVKDITVNSEQPIFKGINLDVEENDSAE